MLKLNPVFKDYLWGGEKLKTLFGKQCDGIIAESWEVSIHPDGLSIANNQTFAQYLNANPTAVDKQGNQFRILIKYIDAKTNLSVQVHPNDEYARRVEGDNGKMETWYIVDADDGAGIYCGFNQDVDKKAFAQALEDGSVEKYLNFVPVKKGDCFLILPGTVHAICGGCVICEVQQSSNVTYRVYDYNRVGADGKKRPLHVQKAMEVINFSKCENALVDNPAVALTQGANALDLALLNKNQRGSASAQLNASLVRQLSKCQYFDCKELTLNGVAQIGSDNSFVTLNVVSGNGQINGESFSAGDSFFLDCGEVATLSGNATIVLTTK